MRQTLQETCDIIFTPIAILTDIPVFSISRSESGLEWRHESDAHGSIRSPGPI